MEEGGRRGNGSRRAKTSAAILIAALAVFAAIVVLAANSLSWPLASDVQNFIAPPRALGPTNSSLLVSAASFVPETNCGNGGCEFLNSSSVRLPIAFAPITVYAFGPQNILRAVARNTTNANGTQLFLLEPGLYQVTIMTPQLGNVSEIVTANPENTTELDISIRENTYQCIFFESSSSVSTSMIAPWDTIYMTLRAGPTALNSNESIYLEFVPDNGSISFSPSSLQANVTQSYGFQGYVPQRYGIRIINQYAPPGSGTLSVQAELDSVASIAGASSIYLLTYLLSYATLEYPMLSNATYVLPFPGAFS